MHRFKGFSEGFPIGYEGPTDRADYSNNILLRTGSPTELWNKVMKEVRLGRYAGPYQHKPPFTNFVQSPISLVPKAGGKTRLIFHLSYKFPNGNESINHWTPKEKCSVKYNDLDHAIKNCIKLLKNSPGRKEIFFSKTDLDSAFRQVCG